MHPFLILNRSSLLFFLLFHSLFLPLSCLFQEVCQLFLAQRHLSYRIRVGSSLYCLWEIFYIMTIVNNSMRGWLFFIILFVLTSAYSFTYRIPIDVRSSAETVNQYQLLLVVDTASLISAGHMSADCSDIRFTSSQSWDFSDWGGTFPYYIESGCNTSETKIWVKLPTLSNTTTERIYMYYGDSLPSASDPSSVFDFYDDFLGETIDSSMWYTNASSQFSVTNGYITMWGDWNGNAIVLQSVINFTTYSVVEGRWRIGQYGGVENDTDLSVGLVHNNTIFYYTDIWAIYDGQGSGTPGNKSLKCMSSTFSSDQIKSTSWHNFEILRDSSSVRFWDDYTDSWLNCSLEFFPFYISLAGDTDSIDRHAYIDWIRVRKYVSSDPIVSYGIEEQRIGPYVTPSSGTNSTDFIFSYTGGGNHSVLFYNDFSHDGLILWLPLEEGYGNKTKDYSGHVDYCSIDGATWEFDNGRTYLNFSGSDSYVKCGPTDTFKVKTFTLEMWVYPDDDYQKDLMFNGKH
ncbi:MAG TPA: DUF2341 domain-containing protein, partial [Euryarchaeota archaeon]|nr:DUF2341 domain-containing protein [Euryarchaeota archaeon]